MHTPAAENAAPLRDLRRRAVEASSTVVRGLGLDRLAHRLHRRRGGLVLAFHDIREEHLEAILEEVAARYALVPLAEIVARMAAGRSTVGIVAVTFDDGVGATVHAAARVAARHGWPMTFFLPTGFLDSSDGYWFQKLVPMLAGSDWTTLELPEAGLSLRRRSLHRDLPLLSRHLKAAPDRETPERLLEHIREQVGLTPAQVAALTLPAPVAWEDVRALARREELSFEAHSHSHLAMSALPEHRIREEMEVSKRRVEEESGRPARFFCYPFGSDGDVGPLAPRVARDLFDGAVTLERGRLRSGSDLYRIPRVALHEEDTVGLMLTKIGLAR